ncbi:MAG: ferrous iron transport protein A [Bacteroides sp.]|nr:ferrous iron transport protein A [Eubacterium sp.]MCM1419495.1 ferrous iron transport protein A [Roseburia sp.]MCM1463254.1 ferrous iron transport protein A [Bacteroides sp.]
MEKRLCDVSPGERVKIKRLYSGEQIRRRLLDIGLVEGTAVECIGRSPGGDPSAYLIRGAVIAIRREDSRDIAVDRGAEGVWD